METYICDICGYTFEYELGKTNNGDMNCPICRGHCLTEEEYKGREDVAKLIDEDKGNDDMTSQQDAMDEAVDLIIIEGMRKNMKEIGNDKLYKHIENISLAISRARYRKYFFLVGGQVPQGEPIII